MHEFSFEHLTDVEFEEFCFDLLHELGFMNIDWRKGTNLNSSPSDRGRDIVCQHTRTDVDETFSLETWFVDCKHYRKGVPPEALQGLLTWAEAKRPDHVLVVTSGFLSNPTKDYLQDYKDNRRPPFRIRYWERPKLEKLTSGKDNLVKKFRLAETSPISMSLATSALSGKWWRFSKYIIDDDRIKAANRARLQQYELTSRAVHEGLANLLAMLREIGARCEWDSDKDFEEMGFAVAKLKPRARREFSLDQICRIESIQARSGIVLAPLMVNGRVFEPEAKHIERLRGACPLPSDAGKRIVDWCSEHGLLGILPHIAESVYMAPRWRRSGRSASNDGEMVPVLPGWQRVSGSWSCGHRTLSTNEKSHLGRHGTLVDPAHISEFLVEGINYGVVYIRHADAYGSHSEIKLEGLIESWTSFFPDVPSRLRTSFEYPRPLTDEFWRMYSEPLETFLRYAVLLFEALTPTPHAYNLSPLIEPIRLTIENHELEYESVVESAQFPSLLSAYALAGSRRFSVEQRQRKRENR